MMKGQVDAVHSSTTNLVDEIILAMNKHKILQCLEDGIPDKRASNASIPFNLALTLSVAAKMKIKTSLTDIPFAITDHRVLAELGWALYDTEKSLKNGLMRESSLRSLVENYDFNDFFQSYKDTVQDYIMPELNLLPNIHILDCTKTIVNLKNSNYEGSAVGKDNDGKKARGYKIATLRGVTGDKGMGIIEDINFGNIKVSDINLSKPLLYNSPVLKRGDILICDRGFLSRKVINDLKTKRGVDIYIPVKSNMNTYKDAVAIAKSENKWSSHPNKNRKTQRIAFVPNAGTVWQTKNTENDVELNACVVWETQPKKGEDEYFVFVTTDLKQAAKMIIKTYELRPEIEEDFRQLKDFWKLEDFKSTKLNFIAFHIMCTLLGYLFFQLYTMLPEGNKYINQSLPIILKNYVPESLNYLVFFASEYFAILSIIDFAKVYKDCSVEVQEIFDELMQ